MIVGTADAGDATDARPLPGTVLERAPCPLGCAATDEPVLSAGDRLCGLPGRFTVVRCRGCGLMRTDPRPTAATIGPYYPSSYGPYLSSTVQAGSAAGGLARRIAHAAFRFRLTELPPVAPPVSRPGRALEVGCASGSFLRTLQAAGWQADGIEFSPEAAQRARAAGFRVHCGQLEGAPEPDEPYDLVVAWMVLEHLHEPVLGLRKLLRWTRPGGWLALSVPNAGSAEFRWFGADWYALQLPTHLTHFTPDTLRRTLSHAGWQPERIVHQRTLSNLVSSVGNRLRESPRWHGLGERLVRTGERSRLLQYAAYPAAVLAAAAGQTGRMCAWARRPA